MDSKTFINSNLFSYKKKENKTKKSPTQLGLSPSEKKHIFICFNENPLKMIKNAFQFILRALFVLKIFKFLSWHFGQVDETT